MNFGDEFIETLYENLLVVIWNKCMGCRFSIYTQTTRLHKLSNLYIVMDGETICFIVQSVFENCYICFHIRSWDVLLPMLYLKWELDITIKIGNAPPCIRKTTLCTPKIILWAEFLFYKGSIFWCFGF